jgi:hypothetical protein
LIVSRYLRDENKKPYLKTGRNLILQSRNHNGVDLVADLENVDEDFGIAHGRNILKAVSKVKKKNINRFIP